jgi:arylsulfatase
MSLSRPWILTVLLLSGAAGPAVASAQARADLGRTRPNVVLMFPDNIRIGEVSSYGGARGVLTPNIDRLGEEGIRFTNFNAEYSCVVSRIALLTGR